MPSILDLPDAFSEPSLKPAGILSLVGGKLHAVADRAAVPFDAACAHQQDRLAA